MDTRAEDKQQGSVQSVEVAGEVLRALMAADGPMRLSDLAQASGMHPAKAHRYLVSLTRIGLASQDTATGLYDLGPMALQMALKGFIRFDILRQSVDCIEQLGREIGETVALVIWGEAGPKFIRMAEARHGQASTVPITHICPLTWSATGLLFSAYEASTRTAALIHREIEQNKLLNRTNAPVSMAELDGMVATIRSNGVSTIENGGNSGNAAVSAPVFDGSGKFIMGISVFAKAGRIDTSLDGNLVRKVTSATRRLSDAFSGRKSF
ncbi:IclR Transcriptional regulator [Paracoccaceae bacterium]|jgi:DNA-binding IclR family transcriptional regulator